MKSTRRKNEKGFIQNNIAWAMNLSIQYFRKFNRSMGNAHRHTLDQNSIPLEIKKFKGPVHSQSLMIGPSNLSFKKVMPKAIDTQEDIQTSSQDTALALKIDSDSVDQDQDSFESSADQNESKWGGEVEAIKIKWNSFIKMKKKNYLEDYTIINQIGKGGFGTVSKVQAKYTGVFRAAKKIRKSSLASTDHEKLFAEMAIMMTLDHPGISRLYEVYDYKSSYVMILELCQGGQLFKKIVAQTINEASAAEIMGNLLQALMYIHAKGIVHRDLKPENILFESASKTSNLKLIDFGIAVKKDSNARLNARIGTPYYIAPQVLCKSYDEKCDLWSAGVILYMMICFRPPFNGDNQTEVMESILRSQPSYNGVYFKNISQDCIDLLKKLLVKNPQNRLSAIQAYNHPWIQKHLKREKCNKDNAIDNISTFKFDNGLEAVVYTFIVSQILTTQEKETLKEIFEILDKNHDGVISSEELKQALLSRKEIDEERIQFLMRIIDTNNSGVIDFTEFIVAALQPHQLSRKHFEQAFAYFDIDHSGFITYDEIASFLEDKRHSENEIRQIFKEIDENHDGEISKEEFLKVLCKKEKERMERERHRTKRLHKKTSSFKDKKP